MLLPKGTIKRIHVNQHAIKANSKDQGARPVLTCKTSKGNHRGHRLDIKGPSTLVYSPDKPLHCGARVWMETRAQVQID